MLFAPTAAKHGLTAPATVASLKKPPSRTETKATATTATAAKKKQAAALLTNGLRQYNHHQHHHQQQQQQHRQHHNQPQQQQQKQEKDQQQQGQTQTQQSSQNVAEVQQEQTTTTQRALQSKTSQQQQQQQHKQQHHVPNTIPNFEQHQEEQQQQQLTMEAMKKLDATLVAYLTGEAITKELCTPNGVNGCHGAAAAAAADVGTSTKQHSTFCQEAIISPTKPNTIVDDLPRDQLLAMFRSMTGIKLQMEAVTLQPEGTKRMELLQNDIRPIFTVECQLSHELIKLVKHSEMFHIMQFESEKFHSLTQCSRFGQEAQRSVKLDLELAENEAKKQSNNNNNNDLSLVGDRNIDLIEKPNLGSIHFTVWWREPGTCLNEMLGMGVLALEELYSASVFEQCKQIVIQRRDVHLANLYFKISLQIPPIKISNYNNNNNNNINQTLATDLQLEVNHSPMSSAASTEFNSTVAELLSNDAASSAAAMVTDSGQQGQNNANNPNNNNDNNVQVETTNFIAETSRVRLLRGLISASEVRQLDLNKDQHYLVCRRFWEEDLAVTTAGVDNKFNYQEQFAVINDEAFLRRVDRQHLQMEVWQRQDGNGNNSTKDAVRPLGVVRLPLHQFFIAYRDVAITNHLCKGKLPVISFDAWAPITNCVDMDSTPIGEMRCTLAIGSDEQIANLKELHGYSNELTSGSPSSDCIDKALFIQCPIVSAKADFISPPTPPPPPQQQLRSTANLLDMLQRSLNAQPPNGAPPPPRMPPEQAAGTGISPSSTTVTVPSTLLKPIQEANVKSFPFLLEIQRANGLPRNPGARGKKSSKRSAAKQQRFPPNEAPSTYVTFQADDGHGPMYKSHEGAVYATNVFEKSTQPQWQQRFRITASVAYLFNSQKRFILKIWKKAATDSPQKRQQPTPMDDAIIGFAALDLSVFMRGLYIAGAFNIVDFNGRVNGQLEVRSQPLECVQKLRAPTPSTTTAQATTSTLAMAMAQHNNTATTTSGAGTIDNFIDELDLTHLNLGQAIKRKFNELEEISQRLRTRLVDVTGEDLAPQFDVTLLDNWQTNKDGKKTSGENVDDFNEFDEFEHDLNTIPDIDGYEERAGEGAGAGEEEDIANNENKAQIDKTASNNIHDVDENVASKAAAPKE